MEYSQFSLRSDLSGVRGGSAPAFCPNPYNLGGPQVEPDASYWVHCLSAHNICMVTQTQLEGEVGVPDPFPTAEATLWLELQELVEMSRLRDEPGMIPHRARFADEAQRDRAPLSAFLDVRPQPLGAVVNTARGQTFPVINSGRELSRYFENETPGLSYQLALNQLLRQTPGISPPRQGLIWMGLFTTIASALSAAWFYKWRGPAGVKYRLRPWECQNDLDVLYDRVTNSTNSDDDTRRGIPFGVRPKASPHSGERSRPEGQVSDILPVVGSGGALNWTGFDTPGTPRHPAYPSGHSTYSAAATRYLSRFFPEWAKELEKMADNIGMARLWAGVHWRTDHTFGQKVGKAVANIVIRQMVASKIFKLVDAAHPDDSPIALPDNPSTDPTVIPNPCP
jgi:hypothetical protein